MNKRADGYYLLRALFGDPDIELQNAQTQADMNAQTMQERYNRNRVQRGKRPINYERERNVRTGWIKHPPRRIPINYDDPLSLIRAEYENSNYLRTVGQDAYNNEDFYKELKLTPRDKAMMGAPLDVKQQPSQRVPEPVQEKVAGVVGKVDIKVHPEDELGNIVTLLKGIRGKYNGLNYRVPKGFESDGVSTPSFLWPIISPPVHPHTIRGGIIHDWIYRHQPKGWTREDADNLFADVIEEDGLSPIQAQLAYAGLRLFGDKAWKENAKRKADELAARKAERLAAKQKKAASVTDLDTVQQAMVKRALEIGWDTPTLKIVSLVQKLTGNRMPDWNKPMSPTPPSKGSVISDEMDHVFAIRAEQRRNNAIKQEADKLYALVKPPEPADPAKAAAEAASKKRMDDFHKEMDAFEKRMDAWQKRTEEQKLLESARGPQFTGKQSKQLQKRVDQVIALHRMRPDHTKAVLHGGKAGIRTANDRAWTQKQNDLKTQNTGATKI